MWAICEVHCNTTTPKKVELPCKYHKKDKKYTCCGEEGGGRNIVVRSTWTWQDIFFRKPIRSNRLQWRSFIMGELGYCRCSPFDPSKLEKLNRFWHLTLLNNVQQFFCTRLIYSRCCQGTKVIKVTTMGCCRSRLKRVKQPRIVVRPALIELSAMDAAASVNDTTFRLDTSSDADRAVNNTTPRLVLSPSPLLASSPSLHPPRMQLQSDNLLAPPPPPSWLQSGISDFHVSIESIEGEPDYGVITETSMDKQAVIGVEQDFRQRSAALSRLGLKFFLALFMWFSCYFHKRSPAEFASCEVSFCNQ